MKLNYKRLGKGEPLIILHGLFGSLDNWQTLARQFGESYQTYIIDQRNHGRSPHSPDMSYPLMASDLLEFMQDNKLDKAHLIGHSMGGKTVMQFASAHPEKVDKLVVVDMGPWATAPGHDFVFEAMKSIDPTQLESRQEAEEQMARHIEDKAIRLFLLKNLTRTKDGFRWKVNLKDIEANYDQILEGIDFPWPYGQPALFIRGGRSDYIDEKGISKIEEIFTGVEIVTIPNAGHWVHAEAPDEFFEEVMKFLGDHNG